MYKAYSNLTRTSSSKSFIPGNLITLESFEKIEETYLQALSIAIEKALEEYEAEVQAMASQEENWGDLGSSLSVIFDKTDFSISVGISGDENTVNQAMELEYGTGLIPPNPMLRNAALGVTTEFPVILSRYV
jgi:hypothetical protein